MSVGIVMLVHTAFDRAEQVARHWSAAGCPIVIHVDKSVQKQSFVAFRDALSDLNHVRFCRRHRCEWGTWDLVAATQSASRLMLDTFPDVRHVYLASGACLPLRPVEDLIDYLEQRPQTDFIESATTSDVPWTIGGLDQERFTLSFPFSWRRHRALFDAFVTLQRKIGYRRKIPPGIVPHMGSQWWCLTRQTLSAILDDPDRALYDSYFRRVWIPDESYFQTLVRLYSRKIESRSLTLSKFDYQGKPHVFYDDHLQLLRRSDCFVARKIWPFANKLYSSFLVDPSALMKKTEPNPGKIDRIFAKAVERRMRGRPGLYMQSRFPKESHDLGPTCAPYSVFEGFSDLFENFEPWLAKMTASRVHGHLFAPDRAEYSDNQRVMNGALSDSAKLRDYNPRAFLSSLIWNTRGERQSFQIGPRDKIDHIEWMIAKDPNAQISVISGAWALPLFQSNRNFAEIRQEAARLQSRESNHLDVLRSQWSKARIRIWSLAEFIEAPMEPLQTIVDEIGKQSTHSLSEVPRMVDLTGFGQFLQNLKNQGMHPYLMGDFPVSEPAEERRRGSTRPYIVR
ncbi:MAG: beta-1,6-N-acetylglucosaminyltransferase [Pseudomonadota bacterium]